MLKFQNSYEVYVEQNNETKKIEKTKIKNITSSFYDGATFTLVEGMWKGEIEKSMKVDVLSDPKKIKIFVEKMKEELHQEAIAFRKVNRLRFY